MLFTIVTTWSCQPVVLSVKLLNLLLLQSPFSKASVLYYGKLQILLGSHFTLEFSPSTAKYRTIQFTFKDEGF